MTLAPGVVVFDCNVFAQALMRPDGPAGLCVEAAMSGRFHLALSEYVLQEIRELPSKLPSKFKVTPDRVDAFILQLRASAPLIHPVPSVYVNPLDIDDSPYIDLAAAGGASTVVSRDRHLLRLNDPLCDEGREFRQRFPSLIVMPPEAFLKVMGG